jgi:hypothetical protein
MNGMLFNLPAACPAPIAIPVAFHAFGAQHVITLAAIFIASILVLLVPEEERPCNANG